MNLFRRNKNNEKEETVSEDQNPSVGTTVDETVEEQNVPSAPVVDEQVPQEADEVQPLPETPGPQVGSDVDEPEEEEVEDEDEAEDVSEPVSSERVPGSVVAPEDTVLPTDVVPSEDYPSDGALPHNTNDALDRIKESEDEANNPILEPHKRDTSVDRQKDETQAEYNERVPVAVQPVQPAPKYNYRGQKM